MLYLCEGTGAETETSNKSCSQDKAADLGVKGSFMMTACFLAEKGTGRLSKTYTPTLRVDQGFDIGARNAECLSGPTPPRELPKARCV